REHGHEAVVVSGTDGSALVFPSLAGGTLDAADIPRLAQALVEARVDVAHFHNVDQPELTEAVGRALPTAVSAHGWSGCSPNTRWFLTERECPRAYGPGCL